MEILLNRCYGGWSVSDKARDLFNKRSGKNVVWRYEMCEYRSDPILIDIVKELGEEANGSCAKLAIYKIPDTYAYWVEDYDGIETLHTVVRQDYLRELIRLGNEDDIVDYVMNAG